MKPMTQAAAAAVLVALVSLTLLGTAAAEAATSSRASSVPRSAGAATVDPAGPQPLMIVLDTSGSMNDDDGTGDEPKIEGATAALVDLVRSLPASTNLGLWSYPSATSGCSPGSLKVPVGPLERTTTSARIRSLVADGDTPTAEALTAAVQHMKDSGYSSGTVLLVSDGEHTCEDPCAVAAALDDDGFDVTVQAMGFQLSARGAEELTCVANATGGSYRDVSDGAALLADLVDVASPDISLDVQAPASVPPAAAGTITATITNTTSNDAHDLTVALSLAGPRLTQNTSQGLDTAVPAVLSPVMRLGNIPAGASITRSWTFSAGLPQVQPRLVSWKVIATGRDVQAASESGELTLTGKPLTRADAGSWLRDIIDSGGRAVIFGDSYSAGEGAKSYFDEANRSDNRCHRSRLTYAMSLFPEATQPAVLACSGAVIENLYVDKESEANEQAQLAKLADLPYAPDLALMTMGGNDIEFASIITACITRIDCSEEPRNNPLWASQPDRPSISLPEYTELLTEVTRKRLVIAYETIATALNTSDKSRAVAGQASQLVILPYPAVLPPDARKSCILMSPAELTFGNNVLAALNKAVKAAVAQAVADGYPVHYVEPAVTVMQPNHTACDRQPWVNPIDVDAAAAGIGTWSVREKELMHPNANGYAATTQAIITWSQSALPLPYEPKSGSAQRTWSRGTDPSADLLLVPTTPEVQLPFDVRSQDALSVNTEGFAPNSAVMISSYSEPLPLGEFVTDDAGRLSAVVFVSPELRPGQHRLVAVGRDPSGAVTARDLAIDVAAPMPWGASLLPVVVALLTLAGLVLVVLGVRRRTR